ncbi:hypothetical protein BV22DRAFT_85063 [Leucogyrophana mollusca]|uniref:Uncharacterized protein n=1 Tax=Leucogyrophana mollusca TaxID=85980 RepID=A0ACB8BX45_9AGAM|nr:hypothetical protein BV22DRAFT_85063 [Leucogyrophana mollusca]
MPVHPFAVCEYWIFSSAPLCYTISSPPLPDISILSAGTSVCLISHFVVIISRLRHAVIYPTWVPHLLPVFFPSRGGVGQKINRYPGPYICPIPRSWIEQLRPLVHCSLLMYPILVHPVPSRLLIIFHDLVPCLCFGCFFLLRFLYKTHHETAQKHAENPHVTLQKHFIYSFDSSSQAAPRIPQSCCIPSFRSPHISLTRFTLAP